MGRFDPAQFRGKSARTLGEKPVSGFPERLGTFGFGRVRIQANVAQEMRVQRGQLATLAMTQHRHTDNVQKAGKDIAAAAKGKRNLGLGHLRLL
jgi:hypothetical protein